MTAPILTTTLNPDDPQAQARAAHNLALAAELRAKLLDIGAGTNEIRRMLIGRELIGAA
jgi:alkylation response protein AidB-like acyl-CoA dehydrogenase